MFWGFRAWWAWFARLGVEQSFFTEDTHHPSHPVIPLVSFSTQAPNTRKASLHTMCNRKLVEGVLRPSIPDLPRNYKEGMQKKRKLQLQGLGLMEEDKGMEQKMQANTFLAIIWALLTFDWQ